MIDLKVQSEQSVTRNSLHEGMCKQNNCKHVRHIRERLDENLKHVDLLSFTSCIPTPKFTRVNMHTGR